MISIEETVQLERDEQIIALFRRHGVTVFVTILPYALLIVLLFLFIFPLFSLGGRGVAVFVVLGLLFLLLGLRKILAWLGTITILTSSRLLVIQRLGFFKKKVNEIKLDQISELSYEIKGALQMFGRYGTIYLLVTFTSTSIGIPGIPDPQSALNAISQAIARVGRISGASHQSALAESHQTSKKKEADDSDGEAFFHSVQRKDPVNWK